MASLLLLFAVGCGTTPDNTGGSSSPGGGESTDLTFAPHAQLTIPVLKYDPAFVPGNGPEISDWFSGRDANAYPADVYVSTPFLYVGYADEALSDGLKQACEEDKCTGFSRDFDVIDGKLYAVMTTEQKAAVEWYGCLGKFPAIKGKIPVALIYVQPIICQGLLTNEIKTNYYVSRATFTNGNVYGSSLKQPGFYFGCLSKVFEETGVFDGTDGRTYNAFMLYEKHEYNGKSIIKNDVYSYEHFTSDMALPGRETKHELLRNYILNWDEWEDRTQRFTFYYDLDALKQLIIEDRAKEA